jgi:flagellar biosynthetic protein FlhB
MAETPEGQERTEPPTPKRLEEAQLRGQFPKSPELTAAAGLLGSVLALLLLAPIAQVLQELLRELLRSLATVQLTDSGVVQLVLWILPKAALVLLPLLGALLILGVAAELVQTGGLRFATKKFPQGLPLQTVFNPLLGLRRLFFSTTAAVQLGKSLLKIALFSGIAAQVLWAHRSELLQLAVFPVQQLAPLLWSITLELTLKLAVAFGLLSVGDLLYQRYRYREELRMTRQELKDELKQTEGDLQVKSRLRSLMQQRLRRWMLQRVRHADVVVTNPTHVAVALQYVPRRMRAPIVVAKGAGYIAEQIRRLAQRWNVPIVQNPPLAQSLYRSVEVDQEIPERLFAAVAEVLAYVYRVYRQDVLRRLVQRR